jgi:hypothetical protein
MSKKFEIRTQMLATIEEALAEADDAVAEAWKQIRIEPELWKGAEYDDFWVVAIRGDHAIWFNDIEGGFNTSAFSERGRLDEYWANQTDFAELLLSFEEAQIAEEHASKETHHDVPEALRGPGRVLRRQTTYWELESRAGARYRVHFSELRERRFRSDQYDAVSLFAVHPLLAHHDQPWASLYVSRAEALAGHITKLEGLADAYTDSWRSLREYTSGGHGTRRDFTEQDVTTGAEHLRRVIRFGYGLLAEGPAALMNVLAAQVEALGVVATVQAGGRPPARSAQLLLLSSSFLIADAFRFEPLKV